VRENNMSMYGDRDKNNIYDEIRSFLEDHPMSELLQIVADAAEDVGGQSFRRMAL
jgi:hypothetical protein